MTGRRLDVRPPSSSSSGTITEITSDDDSVTITNPEGPIVDLSVATGGSITEITSTGGSIAITDPEGPVVNLELSGSGAGVASLSGAGVTESPGILDQAGGMSITDAEGDGFDVTTDGGVSIADSGSQVSITESGPDGIQITDTGDGGVTLSSTLAVVLSGAGANAPALSVGNTGSINLAPNTNETSQNFNVFAFNGNPNGSVTSIAAGDLCVDTQDILLYQSAVADSDSDWIPFFQGTPEPTYPQSFGVSPGLTASPGSINQNGGMDITDSESDGFFVETNGEIEILSNGGESFELTSTGGGGISVTTDSTLALHGIGQAFLDTNGSGKVSIGAAAVQAQLTTDQSAVAFPFTVVIGVNDTFTYTPSATGTPEVFTVAPGVYASLADIGPAITSATGATSDEPFSTYSTIFVNGLQLDWGGTQVGTIQNGDTITPGPTDITAGLDIPNPSTFENGSNGDWVYLGGGGQLSFFDVDSPASIQTVTGALSGVTDPDAQAVLTSLLAALSLYGLIENGTT